MANTLTGLIPTIYKALNTVSRELVGFIPAVFKDSDVEQVAKDQTITYPIVTTKTPGDITPAATGPNPSGETVGTGSMTINKARSVNFPWNGEEQIGISQVYDKVLEDQFAESMRALVNEIELDLFLAAKRGASRAYGAAGTTPFASAGVLTDFAELLKILKDNGAPTSDLHLVLNTTAGTKIRSVQSSLFKVSEAGSEALLRDGTLGRVEGWNLHESGQIVTHVKGTGAGYLVDLVAGYSVGDITVHVDTGTGTILAGDILGFEDDTTKYVVNTGFAGDGDGDIVIGKPGLRAALADGKTVTPGNNYLGNFGFDRNAIHLLTRLPKMPKGGDAADDVIAITDPVTGLSFQVALYRQYRQVVYDIGIAWGVKAVKSNNIATLLG